MSMLHFHDSGYAKAVQSNCFFSEQPNLSELFSKNLSQRVISFTIYDLRFTILLRCVVSPTAWAHSGRDAVSHG